MIPTVTCEVCGLPTDDPAITPDGSSFLCEECKILCAVCKGSGGTPEELCPNCSGSGIDPKYDPDAEVF